MKWGILDDDGESAVWLQEAEGLRRMHDGRMQFLGQFAPYVLQGSSARLCVSPREAVLLGPQGMAILLQQDELLCPHGSDDNAVSGSRQDALKGIIRAIGFRDGVDEEGIVAALVDHAKLLMVEFHGADQLADNGSVARIRNGNLIRWSKLTRLARSDVDIMEHAQAQDDG